MRTDSGDGWRGKESALISHDSCATRRGGRERSTVTTVQDWRVHMMLSGDQKGAALSVRKSFINRTHSRSAICYGQRIPARNLHPGKEFGEVFGIPTMSVNPQVGWDRNTRAGITLGASASLVSQKIS